VTGIREQSRPVRHQAEKLSSFLGHKIYTTGAPILRYFLMWGRTDEDPPRVGAFLVPRDLPGWRLVETWDHIGMRATGSHYVIFDGVEIPYNFAVDVHPLDEQAARDWLVEYVHERRPANLGASLATLPRVQSTVGEIEALLYVDRSLIFEHAAQTDAGNPTVGARGGLIKYVVTNNAVRAVDLALSLVDNPGLSRRNPLERFHRYVLCSCIHTPQDDAVMLWLGTQTLKIA
jgi:alkylation response protein AidB-like acyl-CoA dehydrogenase